MWQCPPFRSQASRQQRVHCQGCMGTKEVIQAESGNDNLESSAAVMDDIGEINLWVSQQIDDGWLTRCILSTRIPCELCRSKLRYCLKLPHVKMLACLYCLGKGKACSLEPPLAEESCKVDADRDLEEAGTARATVSTSVAVMVQTAEALEVMEEVQATVM